MTDDIDQKRLRDAVFKACNSMDAFEDMPYSAIRKETERILGLERKSLKEYKNDITDMMYQFHNVHNSKKRKRRMNEINKDDDYDDDNENEMIKRGKYSIYESNIIMNTVNEYVEANDYELSDVCCEMRAKSEKYKHHSVLWNTLVDLLPNRSKLSIRAHAVRQMMSHSRTGSFTEDEKKKVLEMTKMYGHDWKRIGYELGRMTGDVKDLYKIIVKPRKNSGTFTLQEAARLITAVKKITKSPDNLHSYEIEYENISWKAVATLMNDERLPLDYLRHWRTIRKKSWLGPDLVAGMLTSSQQRRDDRKIISYIAER